MLDLPASSMEFPCNPFPVTFPWEAFRTDDDGEFLKGKGFKDINPPDKIFCMDIGKIAPFSETTEFLSEEMIFQFFLLQEWFKIFPSEYRDFAFRETPHIDQVLDIVRKENFYEIFFCPPVSSKGIYLFHVTLSYHFRNTPFLKRNYFFLDIMASFKLKKTLYD